MGHPQENPDSQRKWGGVEFIDRMIVACAHGLMHAGMFLATLWVRLVFVVICLAGIGVLGLVGVWVFK